MRKASMMMMLLAWLWNLPGASAQEPQYVCSPAGDYQWVQYDSGYYYLVTCTYTTCVWSYADGTQFGQQTFGTCTELPMYSE